MLYAAGARSILVPNMANLGVIPFGLGSGNSAGLTALTIAINTGLDQTLNQLESTLPGLDIIEFDIFGLVDAAIANPLAYGFTNVTDPCVDGANVCANPDQYVFWDTVHPSARSQQIIGEAFAAAVVPEPGTVALIAVAMLAMGLCRRRGMR